MKTLEEPPEYAIIILITNNEEKLLNTIKSRCMKVYFKPIDETKIQEKLKELLGKEPNINIIKKCERKYWKSN